MGAIICALNMHSHYGIHINTLATIPAPTVYQHVNKQFYEYSYNHMNNYFHHHFSNYIYHLKQFRRYHELTHSNWKFAFFCPIDKVLNSSSWQNIFGNVQLCTSSWKYYLQFGRLDFQLEAGK